MNTETATQRKKKGYIQLSGLVLLTFSSAFYPRVLTLLKFPSIINLAHLALVPWLCIFALSKTRVKNNKQIAIIQELLIALCIFLGINLASGLLNNAGIINVFVNFLLLCEHFLFLLAIISIPIIPERFIRFRAFIIAAGFINTLFAYVQRYVLNLHLREGLEDNIKGVFIGQGAGHVVGASVALSFGVYYFFAAKSLPLWMRGIVLFATFWHMNMADAKQVLLVFLVAGVLLLLTKFKNIGQALKYLIGAVVLGYAIYWAIYNVPALGGFLTWARPEIYGPQGEATLLKTATFRVVPTFYTSVLNPFLGLGPGHTVTRLGGWMLDVYGNLLLPLGATIHPATGAIWGEVGKSWLGDQSSMFSPLFGWAGIWGDLGWLGLGSFLYIWFVVWNRLCVDDISKFLVLSVFVFGLIFSQMEEPSYMLYVVSLIAIQWQERQCKKLGFHLEQNTKLPSPRSLKKWIKRLLLISENV
ncbi:MAG: hypothetical protein QNJ47_26225 [Nostocaceae cyanobacterium]|nr:hypothetical protein [Nostocaceae cyanobacterium]